VARAIVTNWVRFFKRANLAKVRANLRKVLSEELGSFFQTAPVTPSSLEATPNWVRFFNLLILAEVRTNLRKVPRIRAFRRTP
jgi:hypothetical protein